MIKIWMYNNEENTKENKMRKENMEIREEFVERVKTKNKINGGR